MFPLRRLAASTMRTSQHARHLLTSTHLAPMLAKTSSSTPGWSTARKPKPKRRAKRKQQPQAAAWKPPPHTASQEELEKWMRSPLGVPPPSAPVDADNLPAPQFDSPFGHENVKRRVKYAEPLKHQKLSDRETEVAMAEQREIVQKIQAGQATPDEFVKLLEDQMGTKLYTPEERAERMRAVLEQQEREAAEDGEEDPDPRTAAQKRGAKRVGDVHPMRLLQRMRRRQAARKSALARGEEYDSDAEDDAQVTFAQPAAQPNRFDALKKHVKKMQAERQAEKAKKDQAEAPRRPRPRVDDFDRAERLSKKLLGGVQQRNKSPRMLQLERHIQEELEHVFSFQDPAALPLPRSTKAPRLDLEALNFRLVDLHLTKDLRHLVVLWTIPDSVAFSELELDGKKLTQPKQKKGEPRRTPPLIRMISKQLEALGPQLRYRIGQRVQLKYVPQIEMHFISEAGIAGRQAEGALGGEQQDHLINREIRSLKSRFDLSQYDDNDTKPRS